MFWTLVRKEILNQLLNIRFYISFALACLFLVPATYILANDYGWMHTEYGPYLTEGLYLEYSGQSPINFLTQHFISTISAKDSFYHEGTKSHEVLMISLWWGKLMPNDY